MFEETRKRYFNESKLTGPQDLPDGNGAELWSKGKTFRRGDLFIEDGTDKLYYVKTNHISDDVASDLGAGFICEVTTATSDSNIYNIDGVLTANRTLGGATFNLDLGTDASRITTLGINIVDDAIVNGSGANFKGATYAADYSADFVNESLVTKRYVDAQVGANNELSEVLANGNTTGANNIEISNGQALLAENGGGCINLRDGSDGVVRVTTDTGVYETPYVYLDGPNYWFDISNKSSESVASARVGMAYYGAALRLQRESGADTGLYQRIEVGASSILVQGQVANFQGATYDADYSADFVARSLVDKDYVDTLTGNYLPLAGGTMTGDINMDDNKVLFGSNPDDGYIWISNITSELALVEEGGNGVRITTDGPFVVENLAPSGGFTYQGDTISILSGGNTGSIDISLISANRTYNLPDASGTIALTSDIPAATGDGIYDGSGTLQAGNTLATLPTGGSFEIGGDFAGTAFKVDGNTGKVTMDGLVDPTGLQLTQVAANPGDANTLWVSSGDGKVYKGAINLEETDGNGIYDGAGTVPTATVSTLTDYWRIDGGDISVNTGSVPGARVHVLGAAEGTAFRVDADNNLHALSVQELSGSVFVGVGRSTRLTNEFLSVNGNAHFTGSLALSGSTIQTIGIAMGEGSGIAINNTDVLRASGGKTMICGQTDISLRDSVNREIANFDINVAYILSEPATNLSQLKDQTFKIIGQHWDGFSATVQRSYDIVHNMTTAGVSPVSQVDMSIDGTIIMTQFDTGVITAPAVTTAEIDGASVKTLVTKEWVNAQVFAATTVTAQSVNYTAADRDFVLMTTGATDKTVTLPAAASNTNAVIEVKKVDSAAGDVIIDGNGAETIDGATTQTITTQYTSLTLHCDGTSWHIK